MAMMMMTQSSGSSACRHPVSRSTAELHWCSQRRPSLPTTTVAALTKKPAVRCWSISSSLRDDSGRELVDEGMPVLRRRILEMKVAAAAAAAEQEEELSQESPPSEEWKEEYSIWETPAEECRGGRQHGGGDGDGQLFHVLGGFLMSSRPGVAVGIAVFLMVSVPASVFVAVCSRFLVEWQRLVFNLTKC